MKRLYFIITMAFVLLAGCSKQDAEIFTEGCSPVFEASFADVQTKTYVDENVKLLWHEGDQISIFYTTLNKQYKFNGKTGDNSGTFTDMMADQYGTGNTTSANYAVYPYMSSTKLSNDEVLTIALPSEQQYAENSFGKGANTMVAVSSGSEDLFLPFKNVGGFLRLKLYGQDITVKSIVLAGNSDEAVAGDATISAVYDSDPVIIKLENVEKEITLNCGDKGVELGATEDEAKDFWIVVPPMCFEDGFTVTVVDNYGNVMYKTTSERFEIERNVVKTMAPFEVEMDESNDKNYITYKTSDNKPITIDESLFDAKILSHSFENGVGKISFSSRLKNLKEGAFRVQTNLTGISLPEGLVSIGEYAFESCTRLETVDIPVGVKIIDWGAFKGCAKLKSMSIPEGVTLINSSAFESCTSLASVSIPEGVTYIAWQVFKGCTSLASVSIPKGITSIESSVFMDCSSLTSISIPEGVTSIENNAFRGCTSLASVSIPEGVTFIAVDAFSGCTSLADISIPEGITDIGDRTFYGCSSLASISIPKGVTSIGESAFSGCI